MGKLTIIVGCNYFEVKTLEDRERQLCYDFTRHNCLLVDWKTGENTPYAAANLARTSFRFHINHLQAFLGLTGVRGWRDETREIIKLPLPEVKKITIKVKDAFKIKPEQEEAYRYMTQPVGVPDKYGMLPYGTGAQRRMLPLATGSGKTVIAAMAISEWGYRPFVLVLARFTGKWVRDLCEIWECKEEEILLVQGSANMKALTLMANTPGSTDKFKAVIVSNKTFDNYLQTFEKGPGAFEEAGYECPPDELWQKLGCGIKLVDEVHMQFHSQFRADLYTNVLLSFSLSATLDSNDKDVVKMYETAYPKAERYHPPPARKFIDVTGVYYSTNPNYRLNTTERGQSSYSHNAYEKSIMRVPKLFHDYANMVKTYLQVGYINDYQPGDKAIVFCSTVDMCTKMRDRLEEMLPDYTIKRYTAEDNYETNYKAPDIRVTTIGSGGTAHDLKGLTCNILTVNIDAYAANAQAAGRLREIEGRKTRFYFTTNQNITKHLNYHNKKKGILKDRASSFGNVHHGQLG